MSGPKVLAVAHAMHQMCAGFLCGATGDSRWKDHHFSGKGDTDAGVRVYFARFEFQDGGKEYAFGRGCGSLHDQMLLWFHGARAVHPEWQICAEYPGDDLELCALAAAVQVGDVNRAPLNSAPTHWIWDRALSGWCLII